MKSVIATFVVFTLILGLAVFPAQAEVKTFDGNNGGLWNIGSNWLPPGEPDSGDDVIIKKKGDANLTCVIPEAYMLAVANTVVIRDGGELLMDRVLHGVGSKLVVSDKMTVDVGGKFTMKRDCELEVTNQITVDGEFLMKLAYFKNKQARATAKYLVVNEGGVAEVRSWGLLKLGGAGGSTSTIDGTLILGDPLNTYGGILQVATDHTMNGKGDIFMKHFESGIEGEAPTDTLTLNNSCSSGMLETCALVLHGVGEIEVELVNNTYVIADYTQVKPGDPDRIELMLLEEDKSGSGFWIARTGHVLLVECDVTGSGTWEAIDETEGGTIQIGSAVAGGFEGCVLATGDVNITGTGIGLRVEALGHFCTSGKLTAGNASSSVVSEIKASHVNNNTATFNATAAGCGPCPTY